MSAAQRFWIPNPTTVWVPPHLSGHKSIIGGRIIQVSTVGARHARGVGRHNTLLGWGLGWNMKTTYNSHFSMSSCVSRQTSRTRGGGR